MKSLCPCSHCSQMLFCIVSTLKFVCIIFVGARVYSGTGVLRLSSTQRYSEQETTSSAAGKSRYVVYSSRVCVENRCVGTPARKGHVEPRALDAAQGPFFLLLFCTYSPTCCPFRVYRGTKPSHPASTATTNEQPTLTYTIGFPYQPHGDEANEQIRRNIGGGGGDVRAARPTKHTKFKINKLTTAASSV